MAKGKAAILDHKASLRMEMIEETESLISMEAPYQLLMPTPRFNFFEREIKLLSCLSHCCFY